MSSFDNNPVRVTGEERRHPAIRSLARACIALARLRLEQEAHAEHTSKADETPTGATTRQNAATVEEEAPRG